MGVVGLSLEVGRYYLLHSQLQDLADAAALAGVKKLDGTAGARDRAKDAAEAVDNPHWWSNTVIGPRLDVGRFFFYARLNPDLEATSDTDAFYMKVTTNFGGISPAFLTAVGAVSTNQTRATATAAFLPIVCNVQPLMMCNPLRYDEPCRIANKTGHISKSTWDG
jgi:Flp pilus assembly protein TadG